MNKKFILEMYQCKAMSAALETNFRFAFTGFR